MSEINFIADLPPVHHHGRHHRPKSFWAEVFKFLGIFIGIFAILSLIVMGPTLYAKLAYDPTSASKTGLPNSVDNDPNSINNLVTYVDQKGAEDKPDSLVIPKINVDAPIVYPTSGDNVSILDAIHDGVAHYPDTAEPGHNGNVVITGHSSYYWWNGGKFNNVFATLDKLAAGDVIYVYYKGDKFIYRVNGHKVVQPSQVDVLESHGQATLSIITCTPVGTNLRRLVVTADLIGRPPVESTDFSNFQQIPKLPTILPLY